MSAPHIITMMIILQNIVKEIAISLFNKDILFVTAHSAQSRSNTATDNCFQ